MHPSYQLMDFLWARAVQGWRLGSGKVGGEGERPEVLKLLPVRDPKNGYERWTFPGGQPHQTARGDSFRVCIPAEGCTNLDVFGNTRKEM